MDTAIVCDIDGTLANIEHRRHFLEPKWRPCKCVDESLQAYYLYADNEKYCQHCESKLDKTKPNWKAFHAAMDKDTPNKWCVEIINKMVDRSYIDQIKYKPIFVTGREEEYREVTERQINVFCGGYILERCELFMRPSKDYRKDADIKAEIFIKEIRDKYDVIFVLDDRTQVVEMWRRLGLVCLQCAKGDF